MIFQLIYISTLFFYTSFKTVISTYLILTYFNKFNSTYFDVFQHFISTLFQRFEGLKYVEFRNLFQRYFNVILTPGFTDADSSFQVFDDEKPGQKRAAVGCRVARAAPLRACPCSALCWHQQTASRPLPPSFLCGALLCIRGQSSMYPPTSLQAHLLGSPGRYGNECPTGELWETQ